MISSNIRAINTGPEPYSPSKYTWYTILALAGAYLYLMNFQVWYLRYAMLGLVLVVSAGILFTGAKQWVLALPVLVTFGGVSFSYGPFSLSLTSLGIVAAAGVYVFHRVTESGERLKFPLPVKLVALAYLAQLASIFATLYLHDSPSWNVIREGHKIFIGALLLPLVYDWYGRGIWLSRMLKVLTLMLLAMAVYGLYQYSSGNLNRLGELSSGFDIVGRVYSTIDGGPNAYSGVLELLVPTVLAAMFHFRSRLWKAVAFSTVILGVLNTMYTYSRGGFLTVSGACLLYLIYRFRRKIWIPVVSLVLFVGFVVANAEDFHRQLTMFSDARSLMLDTSLLHRYTSYKGYLEEMMVNPLEGTGWGGREFYHGRTALYGFWEVRHEDSVNKLEGFGGLNSLVLEMPLKGGGFSALSLLLLMAALGVTAMRILRSGAGSSTGFGLLCGVAGFSLHQVFDNLIPWPQTGAFFWIVFALLTAMAYPCCVKEKDSL